MEKWSVAGYGDTDNWNTVEGRDTDSEPPTDSDLSWIDEVCVHIVDSDGVDWWYNLHGPWESWEEFGEEVELLYDHYSGEMA
jgi:hypothetical protein